MSYTGDELSAGKPSRQHVIELLEQLHEFKPGAHESALQTLQSLERESVIATLTDFLADPDDSIRADAAEVLPRLDAQRALPMILPLLNDPIPEMRWYICGLLSTFGDARAVLPLATILRTDSASDVRFFAALALHHIGDARAIPALTEAQRDSGTDYEGRQISTMAGEAIAAIISRDGPQSSQ